MNFAGDFKSCEECNEPTKRVCGLWDGVDEHGNDVSGCFYDCDNMECAIKQERCRKIADERANWLNIRAQNIANGTSAKELRKMRRKSKCSLGTAAVLAGVTISEYSAMEAEKKTLPMNIYQTLRLCFFNAIILARGSRFIDKKDGKQ